MKLLYAVLAIKVLPTLSIAQECTPYWTNISPFSCCVGHIFSDEPHGRTMYAYAASPPRVYRFTGRDWEPLNMAGTPPAYQTRLLYMDAGDGHRLYLTCRVEPYVWQAFWWNGSSWVPMPKSFATYLGFPIGSADLGGGPRIYGRLNYDGRPVGTPPVQPGFGYWDGSEWVRIAHTSHYNHAHIWLHDGKVFFFGDYDLLNGEYVGGFAAWDGQEWSRPWPHLQLGPVGTFRWTIFDDGTGATVYASGLVEPPNQRASVWKWTGAAWELFGMDTSTSGIVGLIDDVTVFDDGRGPSLYITGGFSSFNNVPAKRMIRWDGKGFEEVPNAPLAYEIKALDTAWGHALVAWVGSPGVGGGVAAKAAAWVGCPNCYANCDLSTAGPKLNIADFVCFLQKFAANDPYANCDNSSAAPAINIADFQCFLQKFAAGCP
jgi:hypothetical protein